MMMLTTLKDWLGYALAFPLGLLTCGLVRLYRFTRHLQKKLEA
jgi:hypothetical protein